MRTARWSALVICMLVAAPASAQEVPLDQLPPRVIEHAREFENGVELLDARKAAESGKEWYVVGIQHRGQRVELFVSPDGQAVVRKEDPFSFRGWLESLWYGVPYLLVLVIIGAVVRWLVQLGRNDDLSVLAGWLAAWCGAAVALGMFVSAINTIPREKNVPNLAALCAVWAGVAASVVELLVIAYRRARGKRCGWGPPGACLFVACLCLALSIPVELWHRHWADRYFQRIVARHVDG